MSSKMVVTPEEEESLGKELTVSHPPKLHQPYPYLIICDSKEENSDSQMLYSHSILGDKCRTQLALHLQNKKISFCYGEWLVLRDHSSHDCSLLNVSTMEKIQLPPLDITEPNFCVFLPEKDGKWHIVFFEVHTFKASSCHLGDKKFIKNDVIIDTHFNDLVITATYFQGKLYAFTFFYSLAISDLTNGHHHFTRLIDGEPIWKLLSTAGDRRFYLVGSCEELLFIFINYWGNKIVDVKILRADFNRRQWVRLDRLGDRAIFLDDLYGFSSPASVYGLRSNSLYLVKDGCRYLYVYDIERQTFSISDPCSMVKSSCALFWMSLPNK